MHLRLIQRKLKGKEVMDQESPPERFPSRVLVKSCGISRWNTRLDTLPRRSERKGSRLMLTGLKRRKR